MSSRTQGLATGRIRGLALGALVLALNLAPRMLGSSLAAPAKLLKMSADDAIDRLKGALSALSVLHLDEAERLLDELPPEAANDPTVLFARAELAYNRGQYREAVRLSSLAMAGASPKQQEHWQELHDTMHASLELSQMLAQKVSSDGRYVVLYPPGKDEVVAELALDVLARADKALSGVFGVSLPGPIRLEIYATPEALAQVSALTVEQIHTTGTVALSKWNRLMITSPKALVRGYPWADTITHELTHLVLSYLSGERAPVWLQEGTAKLLERRWRGPNAGLELDAGSRALLHEAKSRGTLLTFEQMHPSIAMLPSEDQAILAFAEVSTFMEAYITRYGEAALRHGLKLIDAGKDARDSLAQAAATGFDTLEEMWRSSLPTGAVEPARTLKRRFRVGDAPSDESADVQESQARKFMRLGDLLWDRGHPVAAATEYSKAHRADPIDPIVAARFGRAALSAGNPAGAIEALEPQRERYPTHAPTHAVLGAAYLAQAKRPQAASAFQEAIWLNPFDPDAQCGLAHASDHAQEAARAKRACALLQGR